MTKKYFPGIQVVIMSHDRPAETLRAIAALKKVNFGLHTNFVISDNPSDIDFKVKPIPPDFEYRLREPCISAEEHSALILKELEFEWTLLTHDDDEILPALGTFFSRHHHESNVGVITGKGSIIDLNSREIQNKDYERRLKDADLTPESFPVRSDLADYLFDLGTLFPASAIIFRTKLLESMPDWESTPNLAGDLKFSMHLAKKSDVAFESNQPVMNYHLHGGNSVYSSTAAGGLHADIICTKLQFLIDYPEMFNKSRKREISKSVLKAKILTRAFALNDRYGKINDMLKSANISIEKNVVYRYASLPVFLGPIKPVVRYLMWKKLGAKNFDQK